MADTWLYHEGLATCLNCGFQTTFEGEFPTTIPAFAHDCDPTLYPSILVKGGFNLIPAHNEMVETQSIKPKEPCNCGKKREPLTKEQIAERRQQIAERIKKAR